MVRNMHWIGIGIVSAVLMSVLVAGCGTQNSNPDNSPTAPSTAGNGAPSAPQTNASGTARRDDNMSGTHTNPSGGNMSGRGTGGMGDNMGGTGSHPGPNGTPTQGGGMGGNK